MKVAVLAQFFPPETLAGANRVAALVDALAERSDVRVAAPHPSYPDPAAYVSAPPPELPDRVRLVRVPSFSGQSRAWPARAFAEVRMALRVARAATAEPPDVVVASSPSMFLGPVGLLAARRRRARFVWDVRDLTWEYGSEAAVVSGRFARIAIGVLARVMWWTARRADLVTCATPGLGDEIARRLPGRRAEVIPNGIDAGLVSSFDPSPPPGSARLRLLYAGLVGHAQGLDVLVEVARLAPNVLVTVAGDGPNRQALEQEATAQGLRNLTFTGYVRPDELARLYHGADVLFAQLQRSELHAATAAPSKLLEYMAAGRPIVYAGEGAAAEFVTAAGAGVVVAPGDAAAIVSALAALSPAERLRLGRAGRAYAEASPTRVDHLRRLAELVQELR
jgi:colanic acid biosynthesis glycosyl transferase WcaI